MGGVFPFSKPVAKAAGENKSDGDREQRDKAGRDRPQAPV